MWIDDLVLKNCHNPCEITLWTPQRNMVVLGNSNSQETECHLENCFSDDVPVLKRYGGGGTVVLHDGCLVLSLGLWVEDYFRNDFYFCQINKSVIATLAAFKPEFSALYQDGLSDLCYKGKKLAGTSLFRSRNYLLYQASLLVDKKIDLIERYLKHPSKEPGYREGKSHREFVTDLKGLKSSLEVSSLESFFKDQYELFLKEKLESHLIAPVEKQMKHLLTKAKAGSPQLF